MHLLFVGFVGFKENDSIRGLCGSKTDEVTRQWRRLHNTAVRELYFSPNMIQVVKSGRMRWAGHVARMREEKRRIQGFGGQT